MLRVWTAHGRPPRVWITKIPSDLAITTIVAGSVRQMYSIVLPGRMAEDYYCVLYDEKYYLVSSWDVYEQGSFDPSSKRL